MSLYATNVEDIYRPSFFELIAADRLIPSLQPVIRHCLHLLSRHLPFSLTAYHPECFHLLLLLLQRHYLRRYDSTFAENFYGLRRVRVQLPSTFNYHPDSPVIGHIYGPQSSINPALASSPSSPPPTPALSALSALDRRRVLLFTVLVPYVRSRLDALYTQLHDGVGADGFPTLQSIDEATYRAQFPLVSRLQRLFVAAYPALHAAVEALVFLYQLRYLFELSLFFAPSLQWTGQTVRRMSAEDLTKGTAALDPTAASSSSLDRIWAGGAPTSLLARLRGLLSSLSTSLSSSAKYLLLASLLAFRFVDWYQAPVAALAGLTASTAQLAQLPIPPPPAEPPRARTGIAVPRDEKVCPLCLRERSNAAASSSGFVFCYPCLFAHVTEYGHCPITQQPCALEQIRKIYT